MIVTKDFQQLILQKLKSNDDEIIPLSSKYFFCYDNKLIFIKSARKGFHIACSPACNFEKLAYQGNLDIIYVSDSFDKTLEMFRSYCHRILIGAL